jgi:hypothetical protein
MDVALIERPIGDPFINREIWLIADEQTIPFERKSVLEENGFRVGLIGGTTPAGLQALLTSEKTCVGRRLFLHSDKSTSLALGPAMAGSSFELGQGVGTAASLQRAECILEATPSIDKKGAIHLQLTPQVKYGQTQMVPSVAEDRSGWALVEQTPTETFTALRFDIALCPNQYAVIGAVSDQPDSFGCRCFVRGDEPAPVQRLLVIRAWRAGPSSGADTTGISQEHSARVQPLASQAAFTPIGVSSP